MPIDTVKSWLVCCDHCTKALEVVAGKTWSEWLGDDIWTRGNLQEHLRRERWTIGMHVLCPDCAVRP